MTTNLSKRPRRHFDVDNIVATRLRKMRNLLGKSQADVAESISLAFQQLQKYEKGSNRISAGRLHQLSELYGCPVGWFFGEFDNAALNPLTDSELEFLTLLRSCPEEGVKIIFQLLNTYRTPALLKENKQTASKKD